VFNPSRDQARQFLFDTWAKHRQQAPLTDLEKLTLSHLLDHPEYHAIFDAPERYLLRDYPAGETNPFLHLSMHLAISEQLSIDQPPGIRAAYAQLCEKRGDAHQAAHRIMDCLAEMIWRAQHDGTPMNSESYIRCLND
jgi:hypothetical protein